jgi:Tol biopolymer transport system component
MSHLSVMRRLPGVAAAGRPTMPSSLVSALAVIVLVTGGGAAAQSPASSPLASPPGDGVQLVAVGDSIPFNSPNDCPGCTSFLDRYADALSAATGKPVAVQNLSEHTGLQVADLLSEVTNQAERMEALADADAIVVGIAHNDVPWGHSDDACNGPADDPVDWSGFTDECIATEVARFTPQYEEVFARIATLRAGRPTILRAINRYNDWIGDPDPQAIAATSKVVAAWNRMICGAAEANGFVCADLATRFNGPDGADPAGDLLAPDFTHPSDKGNEAIAEVLIQLGFTPLAEAGPAAALGAASPSAHPGDGVPDPSGRIAFGRITRMDDFYGQIVALYAVDPDGSDLVQLTDGESATPAWSPDGSQLAFTKAMPDGSFQVAVMAADGSDVRVLTSGAGVSETPTWSPDGSWLAYGYSPNLPDAGPFHTVLYRMDADGSDPKLLGEPDTFDTEPKLSPDGTEVVFTRLRFEGDSQHQTIMVRDLASGEERAIEAAGDSPEHPNWSPDGQWIIYNVASWMTTEVPNDQVERVAADGSGQPEVLFEATATEGGFKAWYSPDGTRIVFGCLDSGDEGACLMDADGSNVQTLIDDPYANENHFSWGVAAVEP